MFLLPHKYTYNGSNKKLSTLASRQIDNHVPLPNLKKITRKTHYTQRKISQNLSEESHCTIHHHYAKTPVLKFNKKKTSQLHLAAKVRTTTSPLKHKGVVRHPTSYPFFFPPQLIHTWAFFIRGLNFFFTPIPFYPSNLDGDKEYSHLFLSQKKSVYKNV